MFSDHKKGHISGAFFNPAVTLAVFIRRKIGLIDTFIYILIQVIAGFFACLLGFFLSQDTIPFAPTFNEAKVGLFRPLLGELLFTFALCTVMLNVATTKSQDGNSFFGLAIAFTVMSAAYSIGNVSGAVLNPAVCIGPMFVRAIFDSTEPLKYIWVYLVGEIMGAVLAACVFLMTNTDELKNVEKSLTWSKILY
jgi:aquaporin Z